MNEPPIKYNLSIPEGYDMFLQELNSEKSIIGCYARQFFYIKKDENDNFIVQKNIYPYGDVKEISKDVFDAMENIINKYNL